MAEGGQRDADRLTDLVKRLTHKKVLKEAYKLTLSDIQFILKTARTILSKNKSAMIDVRAPLIIGGDTHGQYRDLIRLFRLFGWPPQTRYLFLGDYVDRGDHSIEVVCTMLTFKIAYPNNFFLLRGNHETRDINIVYGFYHECEGRFPGTNVWEHFNEVFDHLPLVASVQGSLLCMHGGIPAELDSLNQLRRVVLPTECPREGVIPDLLWSDPKEDITGFEPSPRGLGHLFGADELEVFCQRHGIDYVVRAHQVFPEGFKFFGQGETGRLVTVFSAPNYGGVTQNTAAVLEVNGNLRCRVRVLEPSSKTGNVAQKAATADEE